MNLELTALAIEGYLERYRANGRHPSEQMSIPFTLAEWDGILKALCPETRIGDEMKKFLLGEGPLDGVWFGDPHPKYPGTFWWRAFLRRGLG